MMTQMTIEINQGQDFSGDTIEVDAFTDPSAFTAFSAEQKSEYDLGVQPFFTKHMVGTLNTNCGMLQCAITDTFKFYQCVTNKNLLYHAILPMFLDTSQFI